MLCRAIGPLKVLLIFASFTLATLVSDAPEPLCSQATAAPKQSFEERLLTGLRVKTPSDKAYIARVVNAVRLKQLPMKLVDETYFWARRKAASRGGAIANNPMVYFRPSMNARARAIGVRL